MDKTDIVKFTTKNGTSHSLSFEYANILLTEVPKFKFCGSLKWKSYRKIFPKGSAVCYAIRKPPYFFDIEFCIWYILQTFSQ
jgi:hypothetical protein